MMSMMIELELSQEERRVEASIRTVTGVVFRPKSGAEIEFPLPAYRGTLVELWVVVSGRRFLWALVDGVDMRMRAQALLKYGRRRYLDDGATLDATELLREMGQGQ